MQEEACLEPLEDYSQSVNENWTTHRTVLCNTKPRAYNRTNKLQLGALDTTISWKDEEKNKFTRWKLLSVSQIHLDQQS